MTTGSIEAWSDCIRSNAEYDKLFLEQQTAVDLKKRIEIVQRMQQIVYEESPYIPLAYTLNLQAADKGHWTGWVRAQQDKGSWWYNTLPDTYVAVHRGAVKTQATSSNTGAHAPPARLRLRTRSSSTAARSRGCGPRA